MLFARQMPYRLLPFLCLLLVRGIYYCLKLHDKVALMLSRRIDKTFYGDNITRIIAPYRTCHKRSAHSIAMHLP